MFRLPSDTTLASNLWNSALSFNQEGVSKEVESATLVPSFKIVIAKVVRGASYVFNFKILLLATGLLSARRYSITQPFSGNIVTNAALLTLSSRWMHSLAVHAQPTFLETIGGTATDIANAIITTPDEGLVMGGFTYSYGVGSYDALLAKQWSNRTLAWVTTLGGSMGDQLTCLKITPDGDIVGGGVTNSFGAGDYDILLSKWWANGPLAWATTLGGIGYDDARALTITPDGGIIMAGVTTSFGAGNYDILISKWLTNGTLVWVQTLGGASTDSSSAILTTSNGDIITAGSTNSFGVGSYDVFLAKWLSNSSLAWTRTFGGVGDDLASAITASSDGGFVVGGSTTSFGAGGNDVLISKWWTNGTFAWAKTLGGTLDDYAQALTTTLDGGVVLSGYSSNFGVVTHGALLAKWWNNGTLAWAKISGGSNSDQSFAIMTSSDGGIVTVGQTYSFGAGNGDALVAKLSADGQMFNCTYFHDILPSISDITALVNMTSPNITAQNCSGAMVQNWSGVAVSMISPTIIEQCQNSPPLFLGGTSSTSYTENNPPVVVNGLVTVNAINGVQMTGAKAVITSGFNPSQDVLSFTSANGITGSYNNTLGELDLTGNATAAEYQSVLRSITYDNLSNNPTTTPRTILFKVSDGQIEAVLANMLSVIGVDNQPVLSLGTNTPLNYFEHDSAKAIAPNLVLTDVDNITLTNATVSISNGFIGTEDLIELVQQKNITVTPDYSNGILRLSGQASKDDYQAALESITYRNIASNPTEQMRTISFKVNDGFEDSAEVVRQINVKRAAQSPKKSSPSSSSPSNIGLALGLFFGLGTAAAVAGVAGVVFWRKRRNKTNQNNIEMQSTNLFSPDREEGRTVIGKKYGLIRKINREEAAELYQQTGIEIKFQEDENKTKPLIGAGRFGKLRIAQNIQDNQFVGVKKIKGEQEIKESNQEAAIQRQLSGLSHVMPLLDSVETKGSNGKPVLYQFMPLAGFGSGETLQAALGKVSDVNLKRKLLAHVAKSALIGLSGMHSKQIVHLDLKTSNIVLSQFGKLFIIDFGCAMQSADMSSLKGGNGDSTYFSPSRVAYCRGVLKADSQLPIASSYSGVTADLWALGIMLLELMHNRSPLAPTDFMHKLNTWDSKSVREQLEPALEGTDYAPLKALIKQLLAADDKTQVSTSEFLNNQLFYDSTYNFSSDAELTSAFEQLKKLAIDRAPVKLTEHNKKSEDTRYVQGYFPKELQTHQYVNEETLTQTTSHYVNE